MMVVAYFGFAHLEWPIDAFSTAVIVLVLTLSAFAEEILWGAILSIDRGQWEAAASIGMTRTQAMRRAILPQALRTALPPLGNSFISLVNPTGCTAPISPR